MRPFPLLLLAVYSSFVTGTEVTESEIEAKEEVQAVKSVDPIVTDLSTVNIDRYKPEAEGELARLASTFLNSSSYARNLLLAESNVTAKFVFSHTLSQRFKIRDSIWGIAAVLSVLRHRLAKKLKIEKDFAFSTVFIAFHLFLERFNFFLNRVIEECVDNSNCSHPDFKIYANIVLRESISFHDVMQVVRKYGLVPDSIYSGNPAQLSYTDSSCMATLRAIFHQAYLQLREASLNGASKEELLLQKEEFMKQVYKVMAISVTEPPENFSWSASAKNKEKGKFSTGGKVTPLEFFKMLKIDFEEEYVTVSSDPRHQPIVKLFDKKLKTLVEDPQDRQWLSVPHPELMALIKRNLEAKRIVFTQYSVVSDEYWTGQGLVEAPVSDLAAVYNLPIRYSTSSSIPLNAHFNIRRGLIVGYNLDERSSAINRYLVEYDSISGEGYLSMSTEFLEATVLSVTVPKSTLTEEMKQVWEAEERRQVLNY